MIFLQTIGIHVRGSGNGVASDRHNPMLAETRLQWSSDSTVGVSPSLAVENGRRRQLRSQLQQQQQQQQEHHHHHMHHYYHLAAMNKEITSTSTTSGSSVTPKTNGVHATQAAAEAEGCSGCVAADIVDEEDRQSDSEVDVCAYCSEWLSKALLCSCQVRK